MSDVSTRVADLMRVTLDHHIDENIKLRAENEQLKQKLCEQAEYIRRFKDMMQEGLGLIRAGIGGNYGGECYEKKIESTLEPLVDLLGQNPSPELLSTIKADAVREKFGEPFAWVVTRFGGVQPDDQTEYQDFVLNSDIEKAYPDLDRYSEHGLAAPLFIERTDKLGGED